MREKYCEDLDKVVCNCNPAETDLAEVFDDDIARAVWVTYRKKHIVCKETLETLKHGSLEIAKEIRKWCPSQNPVKNMTLRVLATWIASHILQGETGPHFGFISGKTMLHGGVSEAEQFTEFIYPYLMGTKVATIVFEKGGPVVYPKD